ncbi:MAG: hypothetical protein PCFJNLEI_00789 [Verrucomicrobiae bacterium]|nr:hypothetical protein [Verrucomicrobiae bacterium]
MNTHRCLVLLLLSATCLHAAPPRILAHGERLRGSHFATSTGFDFVDWNADGILDFYCFAGSMFTAAIHLNYGTRTEPLLRQALWYPLNITETVPFGLFNTQAQILGDLNGDGLWDIIYYDGQFRMAYNTGTRLGPNHWNLAGKAPYFPGSPQMLKDNARITVTPESMYWGKGVFPRQVLTATVADWDKDGLMDLIVCRFKGEAPGVGLATRDLPLLPSSVTERPTWLEKLDVAPARELYFYKNLGTREKPWFDTGVEITTAAGQSLAAPNPVVVDLDGDGMLDIVSTETFYRCNAFRVDWPTNPHVVWFKGRGVARVEPAQPVVDGAGKPIPAGVQARLADYRGVGGQDLFVLDPSSSLRWYQKEAKGFAPARPLTGQIFNGSKPVVTDWFAPGSRDLLTHGEYDAHCQWAYRRTGLLRNVATRPGELKYEFVGHFNYQGDPMLVPHEWPFEDRQNDLFGSRVAAVPPESTGGKRLVISAAGRLYLFRKLAADGLTFQERIPLNLPNPNRNRCQGWQDIPVKTADKVRFIRISNDPGGMGITRDGLLHIVNFEALVGGKNVATLEQGARVKLNPAFTRTPQAMLTPGNAINDTAPSFTSFGFHGGPAVVELPQPVQLEKIRFQLADRQTGWYTEMWGLSWQGKRVRHDPEIGQVWFHYKVEVSADATNWTVVADKMLSEMNRSTPVFVDWDRDGKFDLVLGVMNERNVSPYDKEYRLYLNRGTNDDPKFVDYRPLGDESGAPLRLPAGRNMFSPQCDLAVLDRHGDGSRYDLVVEDAANFASLRFYENIGPDPKTDLKFKYTGLVGDGLPVAYGLADRNFTMADADGDGIVDLIDFASGFTFFFKGIAASAPVAVTNLTVRAVDKDRFEVQWTRPKGASRYELRSGTADQRRESDWSGLPAVAGDYAVAEGALQTAHATLPIDGQVWSLGVKSATTNGEWSAISNWAEAIAAPWTRIVLRNGPAGAAGEPAYDGAQGCMVDAEEPGKPVAQKLKLQVYLRSSNKNTHILLRFARLPQLKKLERATLELTTDPSLLSSMRISSAPSLDVTCSAIRDDWEVTTATYAEAAPGKPWAPGELATGGKYLDMARPLETVTARHVLKWDVTEAVREALQAGRPAVSLLLRPEFNGKTYANVEWSFCRPDFKVIGQRPRLCLVGQE